VFNVSLDSNWSGIRHTMIDTIQQEAVGFNSTSGDDGSVGVG
jgi:hypothetical protein